MDLFNSPIKEVSFYVNSHENLDTISKAECLFSLFRINPRGPGGGAFFAPPGEYLRELPNA